MPSMTPISRRGFASRAAIAATAASYSKIRGANDVIGIGVIGLGNISRGHLNEYSNSPGSKVTAVCDIYAPRLDQGVTQTSAKGYRRYEDLIQDPNVDAVIVCTPDHWHAPMAIAAMRAGKDVDVEKPMSLTIAEAKQMVETAEQTGRILAVDSEHIAHGIWEPARKLVSAGLLGKILWSQTSRSRNTREPPFNYVIDKSASPENLDWEAFLGSAPKRPFSRERFFRWRRYRDYSGGIATDLYYHHVTPLIQVLGREFPIRAVSAGGNYGTPESVMEVPDVLVVALDFPSKHTIVCSGSLQNSVELPIVVRGHEANIHFEGNHLRPQSIRLVPEEPFIDGFKERVANTGLDAMGTWVEERRPVRPTNFTGLSERRKRQVLSMLLAEPRWKQRYDEDSRSRPQIQSPGEERDSYFQGVFEERAVALSIMPSLHIQAPPSKSFRQHFLESIRTRKPAPLDGELGYRSQVAVSLGVEAHRRNKAMGFDLESEQVREL
ncbi:MAG: Gfo/Idh/MocA family oxidoreductase [Acidobacteriia bacterium]|nr:Gfo/Idh/MocA family oxidoreductase [Terriglobia bacterium]